METSPPSPLPRAADPGKALLQQAKVLLDADRPEKAVPLLLQALSLAPDDALLPCHLSYTYSRLGDLKNALRFAEQGIAQNGDNEWAHRLRGHVFWTKGNYKEAMKCALNAQTVDPDEPQVYRMQADLWMAQRKWKEAKQAAQIMQRLAPDQAAPLVLLARATLVLAMQGKAKNAPASHKEAEDFARQALAFAPDLPAAHTILGEVLTAQHKTGEALDAFYQASRLDPTAPMVQKNLTNTVFTRFFALRTALLALLLFPLQAVFYRYGGLWGAGAGGAIVGGTCALLLMQRFAPTIATGQKNFRALPDAQRETLLGLMRARRGPLTKSAAVLAAIVSALPTFLLLFLEAKDPPSYRAIIRNLDRTLGATPSGPAKLNEARTVYPWQIAVQGTVEKRVSPPPKTEPFHFGFERPWITAAQKPGRKLVGVRVTMRNTEKTTFAPLAFPSYLEDASGNQVSESLQTAYHTRGGDNFTEGDTEQSGGAWKPDEGKTGCLWFVVPQNARPAAMVMESPTEAGEGAQWKLSP